MALSVTNVAGTAGTPGKRGENGASARPDASGANVAGGNANVSGEETGTTTGIVGNIFGPAATAGPPALIKANMPDATFHNRLPKMAVLSKHL